MQKRIRFLAFEHRHGAAVALLVIACVLFSGQPAAQGVWLDDVGYTALTQEFTALGIAKPTGAGIVATQVEADETSNPSLGHYRPDPSNSQFNGSPPQVTKTFVYKTASPSGLSNHATVVGQYLYGNSTSAAPGVGTVNVWLADNWLTSGLHRGDPVTPYVETGDVANFSWIGSVGFTTDDNVDVLRRLDYQVNRDDFVAVVGMNNGSSTTLPYLLGQGYNTISIGLSSGVHSHGNTTINGAGRMKPDIVAPANFTSYATPMVGSAAEMLLEPAKAMSALAAHSQTTKAILMAGATKTNGAGGLASAWSHTQTQPLDGIYGAGQLNINRSYHVLIGGRQAAAGSQVVSPTGWDFNSTSSNTNLYFFDVPANTTLSELSAVLTWNADVSRNGADYTSSLSDLNLKLWSASGFSLGSLIDQSISSVDNVELLSLHNLPAGRYALGVTSATTGVDYGLAWFADAPDLRWIGAGGTAWSTAAGLNNWKKPINGMLADYANGVNVTFDDSAIGTAADISAADVTPSSVTFDNTGKDFTVTGVKGIVGAGTTVTKRGTGTAMIGSVNSYAGKTTIEAGKLMLQGMTKAIGPVLTGGGADIKGGMLVLDYSTETSPAATVDGLMKTSYHAAGPNHFDIGQFMSTTADSTHGLGWIDNSATSKIDVAYTIYGDVDLNGTVGLSDLGRVLTNWNIGTTWGYGDVDYDGTVGLADLGKTLTHWGMSVGLLSPTAGMSLAVVPEPSAVAMLVAPAGLFAAWFLCRRRR